MEHNLSEILSLAIDNNSKALYMRTCVTVELKGTGRGGGGIDGGDGKR